MSKSFTKAIKKLIVKCKSLLYGGIYPPPPKCNYVNMPLFYFNIQHNNVDMQLICVKMLNNCVNMRLKLFCMLTIMLPVNIIILHVNISQCMLTRLCCIPC